MNVISGLFVPGSKYDESIPYTYMAKEFLIQDDDELINHYFADTICGLLDYLGENGIKPEDVEIWGIYRNKELMLNKKLCVGDNGAWLNRPEICHSLEEYYNKTLEEQYKGHDELTDCSYIDRERQGTGPY
jgi:hypothetical protein